MGNNIKAHDGHVEHQQLATRGASMTPVGTTSRFEFLDLLSMIHLSLLQTKACLVGCGKLWRPKAIALCKKGCAKL